MFNQTIGSFGGATTASTANPMKDFEVTQPPDDSISSLAFSPATLSQNFLIAAESRGRNRTPGNVVLGRVRHPETVRRVQVHLERGHTE
jgi:hypothetical protein